MRTMDIKQLIGEATDYDKKVALETKKPKSWCKSISAFANCFGGKLIFGVSNDSELVGLTDAKGDSETISESIKTHLNPIPEFKLSFEKDGDKTFVIVEVLKGQQTPYYYEGDGQLIAFMRIGNESVPATPSQLRELYNLNYGSSYAIHANEEKIQGDTQDDTQGDTQDDTEEKIIKMIKDNPQVSTADMAKELKIGIATVKRKIKKMSNVSYVGSGYSGHWEING